jgi:hypothetical protein
VAVGAVDLLDARTHEAELEALEEAQKERAAAAKRAAEAGARRQKKRLRELGSPEEVTETTRPDPTPINDDRSKRLRKDGGGLRSPELVMDRHSRCLHRERSCDE